MVSSVVMDSPWGAMVQYRPLLVDINQMSYQNTVAVRNTDDSWWLGYIQDMDGDHALIHFDSAKVTARWIHMASIWLLPFYCEDLVHGQPRGCAVYVALRSENNGPLRFRPAVLLDALHGCSTESCGMFYLKSAEPYPNGLACAAPAELVAAGQVAAQLPPSGPPLLERRSAFLYTKHFIPFTRAQSVLSDASDKFRIIKHLRDAFEQEREFFYPRRNCCRFHMRIERDGCMFITINTANAETAQWMATMLAQVLDKHLASRIDLPAIAFALGPARAVILGDTGWESDALHQAVGAHIGQLTPWLVDFILAHLDLYSQMTAKRVCALWSLLLSSPRMTEHIIIHVDNWLHPKVLVDSGNCYKLLKLVSRSISSTTKCLTFLNAFFLYPSSYIEMLLTAMGIRLPLVVFKDQIVSEPSLIVGQNEHRLKHAAAWEPTSYKHYCESVVLYNWKVADLFGFTASQLFQGVQIRYDNSMRLLPEHEQNLMKPLKMESHALDIDKLQISIPRLVLKCSEGRMRMTSRFMCAVNENFPPVTPDMLAKVTAVHARWVRNLEYPDEWQTIRMYLLVFSGFHADGSPRYWWKMDLRLLNVSTLSKLAIYGINEIFAL
ncbi:uncharacterized protein LOC129584399 [Paramacrobiotus metropolitanus]|uniref:uncharacterized protein LOC129584399 n=1 Tax=Paramacrobiotus metropolitanus TaxID=2943436 RepID=UPI002445A927|nr:uncharacterized protein LOC129584399 [Paramacrobiotus metropolitanus]XP_055332535.1 uncharacterized protein LOC129584399 [Paramacrobiotus metropolitanus]